MSDPAEPTVYPTRDEAIAAAALELAAEGGGEVLVHAGDCRRAADVTCSCTPTPYVVAGTGAKA